MADGSEILIYTSPDGKTRIDVAIDGETVWLSQAQLAELFQTTKQNVSLHINNIFEQSELSLEGTVKESLTVQLEGGRSVRRSIEASSVGTFREHHHDQAETQKENFARRIGR